MIVAAGETEERFVLDLGPLGGGSCLKAKRGWTVLGAHAVGPGGVNGAAGLLEAMREAGGAVEGRRK